MKSRYMHLNTKNNYELWQTRRYEVHTSHLLYSNNVVVVVHVGAIVYISLATPWYMVKGDIIYTNLQLTNEDYPLLYVQRYISYYSETVYDSMSNNLLRILWNFHYGLSGTACWWFYRNGNLFFSAIKQWKSLHL